MTAFFGSGATPPRQHGSPLARARNPLVPLCVALCVCTTLPGGRPVGCSTDVGPEGHPPFLARVFRACVKPGTGPVLRHSRHVPQHTMPESGRPPGPPAGPGCFFGHCGKIWVFPSFGNSFGVPHPGTFRSVPQQGASAPLGSELLSLHGPPCLGECTFSSQCMPPRIPYIPAGGAIGSVPMLMACTSCCSPATRSRSQQSRHPVWRPSSAAACVHSPSLRSVGGGAEREGRAYHGESAQGLACFIFVLVAIYMIGHLLTGWHVGHGVCCGSGGHAEAVGPHAPVHRRASWLRPLPLQPR